MMISLIGTNAGLVWKTLSENKKGLSVKEIQTLSGIRTQNEIYLALGWLAREGKVQFIGSEKNFKVILSE